MTKKRFALKRISHLPKQFRTGFGGAGKVGAEPVITESWVDAQWDEDDIQPVGTRVVNPVRVGGVSRKIGGKLKK